jgi:ABC-type dipeptide/oligopeptide/nickel transport system permease component
MTIARLGLRVLTRLLPVLAGVSLLVFAIVHLIPGDPAVIAAGLESSPETVARIRRDLGLDQPLVKQFATFVSRAVRGDFGTSIRTGRPVGAEIADRLPHTMILAAAGVALAVAIGVPAGIAAAIVRRTSVDRAVMAASLIAVSTPSFWLALMLMLVFSLGLGLLPAIGVGTPAHYVLPVIALGLQSAGQVARMTRASMLDVLKQDFLRAARAKGLRERTVIFRHALGNALLPIVNLIGLRVGGLLAGTVLVETVFAIPGVGRMMVDAVIARDFPMIQGGVLFVATLYVLVNAATDLLTAALDPRLRA